MPPLSIARPVDIGVDPERLKRAYALLSSWAQSDRIPSAGVCIGRRGKVLEPFFTGHAAKDSLFLVASLTKPVTVAALLLLVERGLLTLDDPVAEFIPRFAVNGKQEVLIRHLMTHTSGLPDMPPDNLQLRKDQRPLSAFIESTLPLKPLFEPGAGVSYQSMGTAILGEVLHQVTGTTLPDFLAKELFAPLGMGDTSLGWDRTKKDRILPVRLPRASSGHEAVWNSPYWLGLGAPWGGLITSPADYARFCQLFLHLKGTGMLSAAGVRAMTTNQLEAMPKVPEEERRCRPWALGWRLNWAGSPSTFGDLLGPRSFGHWGATGTLAWCDPDGDAFAVVLTTQPLEPTRRWLVRFTNAVCAAMV